MSAVSIVVAGNLGADPNLRANAANEPFVTFSVAANERRRNEDGQWEDAGTSWFKCSCWGDQARHIAKSLHKGDRIVVAGTLRQREYTVSQGEHAGERRTVWEVTVADAGPSLKFHAAKFDDSEDSYATAAEDEPAF
jgi:single-strand DNA-binding protein